MPKQTDEQIDAELTKHAIRAALTLEAFCAREIMRGAEDKEYSLARPARLIDELRFFLDVHCPNWRPIV